MKLINLIILLAFLVSCTKELDYNFNHNSKLVLNGLFTPNEPFEFTINTTTPIDNLPDTVIDKVELKLYEDDVLLLDTVCNSSVISTQIYPKVSTKYTIECSVDGYPTIKACDSVPNLIVIQGSKSIFPIAIDEYGDEYGKFEVEFTDELGANNFYQLEVQNYCPFDYKQTDKVLINEGDLDYYPVYVFFSDELINGEQYTLNVIGVQSFYNEFTQNWYVTLKSISENYYLYLKYLTRHLNNQQIQIADFYDFVYKGEPIDMYTNIENGYGIFAGYQTSIKEIELKK